MPYLWSLICGCHTCILFLVHTASEDRDGDDHEDADTDRETDHEVPAPGRLDHQVTQLANRVLFIISSSPILLFFFFLVELNTFKLIKNCLQQHTYLKNID